MSSTSFIGFILITIFLCVIAILLSLDYNLAESLVYHLDITDAFFGLLFLILIFAL